MRRSRVSRRVTKSTASETMATARIPEWAAIHHAGSATASSGSCSKDSRCLRPVFHKKDDRIRSHVFLCLLAYYLQWHAQQRLKPLFAKDGKGKDRQWTFSTVMERLKALRRQRMKVGGVEFDRVSEPEADQSEILGLLKGKKP